MRPEYRLTPQLEEVDARIRAGLPLDEYEARADLASLRYGPHPDGWWAERWGWRADEVARLRGSDWRTRAAIRVRA